MPLPRELSEVEVRVIGCLVEKEATTPDQYPLTVNSLKLACNQKTNRFPLTNFEEGEIGHALRQLEELGVVKPAWGARVPKYEHRAKDALGLNTKELAVMYPMLVRGPETASEIRARSHKHAAFDDVDDVEYLLDRLGSDDRKLVVRLDKLSGQKEHRYMHLLSGEPDPASMQAAVRSSGSNSSLADRLQTLEATVETLKRRLEELEQR